MCIVCASRRYIRGTFLQAKNKRHFFTIGLDFFGRTAIIIHVAIARLCKGSTTDSDSVCWGSNPYSPANTSEQIVPRLFYARILLFTAVFRHFFFASKSCESFWEILRDSKFQNSKVILVRFRAFMTETFERHRSNQNRNTNWNEQNSERIQKIIFITVDFIKARVYNQKK